MEAYANALLWAIPFFMLLIVIEIVYGQFVKKQTYTLMDTISSLSSGITNTIKDSLGLVIVLISYPWLASKLALIQIEPTLTIYVIAFICMDFGSYWSHRLNHKVNYFWNHHIIHHSSEEFNLACALRQNFSNFIGYGAFFLIPAALLGVPHQVVQLLAPIHFFAQFWYHTQHIGKLGILEYIIVTPSQHRVHHAINAPYIDKNLGAIFSVWDRMFGTFQEELEEEPPVYGILKPVQTWNPFWINFQHLWGLVKDAWHTKSLLDKLTLWFRPTGWRPADVATQYPQKIVENVRALEKYNPEASFFKKGWALFQFLGTTLLLLLLLAQFQNLIYLQQLELAILILLSIFGYTAVMDGYKWAKIFEGFRSFMGLLFFLSPTQSDYYLEQFPALFFFGIFYFSVTLISLFFLKSSKSTLVDG